MPSIAIRSGLARAGSATRSEYSRERLERLVHLGEELHPPDVVVARMQQLLAVDLAQVLEDPAHRIGGGARRCEAGGGGETRVREAVVALTSGGGDLGQLDRADDRFDRGRDHLCQVADPVVLL